MTANTTVSAITYPEDDDQPNVAGHIQGMAEDIDGIILPRFSSTSARDSAIPSPSDGHHVFITSGSAGGLYVYRNSYASWQRYTFNIVRMKTADESVTSSTSFQDDNHIIDIPYRANTFYRIGGIFFYDGSTTGDIKWELSFTSTPADGSWGVQSSVGSDGSGGDNLLSATSGSTIGGTVAFGTSGTGMEVGTVMGVFKSHASTAGTMKLRWAQNTPHGTASKMLKGSYLQIVEVIA